MNSRLSFLIFAFLLATVSTIAIEAPGMSIVEGQQPFDDFKTSSFNVATPEDSDEDIEYQEIVSVTRPVFFQVVFAAALVGVLVTVWAGRIKNRMRKETSVHLLPVHYPSSEKMSQQYSWTAQ